MNIDIDIDIEMLISLVENRPVLWDKTSESYKIKQLNFTAWMDICKMIHPSFDTLSDKEKNEFGKNVIKKWNNARDNWMRCDKKIKEYKSGSAAKPVQKYKFYEQMQFLNKIVGHRPTETNMPLAEDVEENQIVSGSPVQKKKMKKQVTKKDQLEKRITRLVESVEKDDQSRIMSFFSGIAPTIEKFNDADIVEFQYEVIKAMRNITQRTQTPYLQHDVPRNYYQNLSQPAQFHLSHPSHVAPNINEDPRGIYRNYNANESNKVHQYMTTNGKRSFYSTAEPSPESIDSLDTAESQSAVSDYDFDFSKSPVFYESLINSFIHCL